MVGRYRVRLLSRLVEHSEPFQAPVHLVALRALRGRQRLAPLLRAGIARLRRSRACVVASSSLMCASRTSRRPTSMPSRAKRHFLPRYLMPVIVDFQACPLQPLAKFLHAMGVTHGQPMQTHTGLRLSLSNQLKK